MRKKVLFVLMVGTLTLLLAGCNQATPQTSNLQTSNQKKTAPPNSVIIKNQVVNGDNKLMECIEKNKAQLTDGSFAKGTLIVGFKDIVSVDKAKLLLQSYKLISASSTIDSWEWKNIPGFLLVSVPTNNELKWKCILENDINIKSVELNNLMQLH